MGRRVIKKTYKDTYAAGQRDRIEEDRYLLRIDLVSIKAIEESDLIGRDSEFYFEIGPRLYRQRTPTRGTIHLQLNEVFKPNPSLTLYTQAIESKDPKTIEIPFVMRERDPAKKDDTIIKTKVSVPLGSNREYLVFKEKGAKVKIAISAPRTRY